MCQVKGRKQKQKPDERRAPLLDAAAQIFLRYGFRKASMDDVATAAGLSRQALYLRFESKEELFREAVEHVLDSARLAAESALDASGRLEERLLSAFRALHATHFSHPSTAAHMGELMEASLAIIGPRIHSLQAPFLDHLARAFAAAGASAREARELADTLDAASQGIKHRASNLAEYEEQMTRVIRVLCRTLPRGVR